MALGTFRQRIGTDASDSWWDQYDGDQDSDGADDGPTDSIYVGLSGEDYMELGGGIDFAYGGINNDTIVFGSGFNWVFGGLDNDEFILLDAETADDRSITYIGDFGNGDDLLWIGETETGGSREVNYREYNGFLILYVDEQRIVMNGVTWDDVSGSIVYESDSNPAPLVDAPDVA